MIKLRKLLESDLERIVLLCQDKKISDMTLSIPYPYTMDHAQYFYTNVVQSPRTHTLAIHLDGDNELIGVIGVSLNSEKNWVGEIGYWIGKEYRNKGFMTEALKQMIELCFTDLGLVRVCACHNPINPASGKVMLKAGMTYEGIFRAILKKNDQYLDSVYYSIIG